MVIDEARRIFYKECRWTCHARLARRSGTIFTGYRMMNRYTREQVGGNIDFIYCNEAIESVPPTLRKVYSPWKSMQGSLAEQQV